MGEKRPKRQRYSTDSGASLEATDSSRRRISPRASPEQGRDVRFSSEAQNDLVGDPTNLIWKDDTIRPDSSRHGSTSTDHLLHTKPLHRRQPPSFKEYMPVSDDERLASRDSKSPFLARVHVPAAIAPNLRHPSVPAPQPPSSIPLSSCSPAPLSPPASRGTLPYPATLHPGLPPIQPALDADRHGGNSRGSQPPSPPASRDKDSFSRSYAQSRLSNPPDERDMVRSASYSSHHSHYSQHSQPPRHSRSSQSSRQSTVRPLSRGVSSSDSNDSDMGEDADETSREPGSSRPSVANFQRPKRTRVLMTHLQQHRLGILWKQSKFPSTQEREEIALEVGLTPRQVQVWFQNRRQTFRKQIQQNAIPPGSDPADYSDLQKSPRSRRLSLEAANAMANEDRERPAHWTGESSSSASSYASRVPNPPQMSLPMPDPNERGYDVRHESVHTPTFAHNPPSPPPRLQGEPDYLSHSAWPQASAGVYRPLTASSGSSQHLSLSPYAASSSRPYSVGKAAPERERWKSYWDASHQKPSFPAPYSPPPTADPIRKPHSAPYLDNWAHDGKRRRQPEEDEGASRVHRVRPPLDPSRPSHLPPSLAALAIDRPLDYETGPHGPKSLSTLGISFGQGQGEPGRPVVPQWQWRGDRRDDQPRREPQGRDYDRFGKDDGGAMIPRPVSAEPRSGEGSDFAQGRDADTVHRSTSTGRLPPLSELFR